MIPLQELAVRCNDTYLALLQAPELAAALHEAEAVAAKSGITLDPESRGVDPKATAQFCQARPEVDVEELRIGAPLEDERLRLAYPGFLSSQRS